MKKLYITITILSLFMAACNKENTGSGSSSVPSTYSFANVNYSGQTFRISMLEEMLDYAITGRTIGTTVDASVLKNMFSNTGSPFTDTILNTCGKQLKNKCFVIDQPLYESYMDSLALASLNPGAGSNGIAGVVTSTIDPLKKYLLSANGWDYTELIEKGLMGGVFYYQAINSYLENLAFDDNLTLVPGEGTAMEHHFDEAFGYFGVPVNFPTNTTDVVFWGEYCNDLDAVLNTNHNMMKSFVRARYAISKKDYSMRDAEVNSIRENWDELVAAAAIHEINESLAYFSDDALRNHTLSEFVGFVSCLKYSLYAKATTAEINTIIGYIGIDLYNVTVMNLNAAKNALSSIYGLDSVKDIL